MEVGLADVDVEVSFDNNIILPSKYLSICRPARGLLNEFHEYREKCDIYLPELWNHISAESQFDIGQTTFCMNKTEI
jgi:hypothetical protein